MLVVEGQSFVLAKGQAWSREGDAWRAANWQPSGTIVTAFGDGRSAFALLAAESADAVQGVLQFSLVEGQLSARALPALPIALRDVHASVNGSNVYVHGLEAGAKPQLYALALKDAVLAWRALPGCDAAGVVEHLVAHEDAVYAVVAPADGSGERLYRLPPGKTWGEVSHLPGKLVAGAARAVGQGHILFVLDDHGARSAATFYTLTREWANHGSITLAGEQQGGGPPDP